MKNLLTEGASSLKDLWLIFSQGPLGARPKLWRTRESQWKRVSCSGKSTSSISSRGVNWPKTHMNPQELTDQKFFIGNSSNSSNLQFTFSFTLKVFSEPNHKSSKLFEKRMKETLWCYFEGDNFLPHGLSPFPLWLPTVSILGALTLINHQPHKIKLIWFLFPSAFSLFLFYYFWPVIITYICCHKSWMLSTTWGWDHPQWSDYFHNLCPMQKSSK